MLLVFQFPIVDVRGFLPSPTGRVKTPVWPIPEPNKDFVRSFGIIRSRPRGGLTGWLQEGEICEASNALRFSKDMPFQVAFRRFYFDGMAVGKYEIGLNLKEVSLEGVRRVLYLNAFIRNQGGTYDTCNLIEAGKKLARLYFTSTTEHSSSTLVDEHSYWVHGCEPILLADIRLHENLDDLLRAVPNKYASLRIYPIKPPSLQYAGVSFVAGKFLQVEREQHFWLLHEKPVPNDGIEDASYTRQQLSTLRSNTRDLRLALLRIHAERECLKNVLRLVSIGKVPINRGTTPTELLQRYLKVSIKRILRFERYKTILREVSAEESIYNLAIGAYEQAWPGTRESIIEALEGIRPNILARVDEYLDGVTFKGDVVMGDKYTIGQAGAVGPHSQAHDINFNQVWLQQSEKPDLSMLVSELSELRSAMRSQATTAQQDVSVAEIAYAEVEAQKGNGSEMLAHLAKAGNWALDVATKIGTSIAAEMIKKAMGV